MSFISTLSNAGKNSTKVYATINMKSFVVISLLHLQITEQAVHCVMMKDNQQNPAIALCSWKGMTTAEVFWIWLWRQLWVEWNLYDRGSTIFQHQKSILSLWRKWFLCPFHLSASEHVKAIERSGKKRLDRQPMSSGLLGTHDALWCCRQI